MKCQNRASLSYDKLQTAKALISVSEIYLEYRLSLSEKHDRVVCLTGQSLESDNGENMICHLFPDPAEPVLKWTRPI